MTVPDLSLVNAALSGLHCRPFGCRYSAQYPTELEADFMLSFILRLGTSAYIWFAFGFGIVFRCSVLFNRFEDLSGVTKICLKINEGLAF